MISFNSNQFAQYTRPANSNLPWTKPQPNNNHPNRTQFYVPPQNIANNSFTHSSSQNAQKIISSSRTSVPDMTELNQDLNKLKEQLKKLSTQQQELHSSQSNRESLLIKQSDRPKSNLSSDAHFNMRKDFSYTGLSHSNRPLQSQRDDLPKTISQNNLAESNPALRVVPIVNPNKRQSERLSNVVQITESRVIQPSNNANNEASLRHRVASLQKELEVCKAQNQTVRKDLIQTKEKLKEKELQQKLLNFSNTSQKEQREKQLQLERNQHLQIVQKLYKQIDQTKKAAVLPGQGFDIALKTQIQTNQELKRQLQDKQQQITSLKDQIQDCNNNIQNLQKQLQIQQLKINADYRAKIQRLQIKLVQKENEIQSSKRSVQTLECRYRATMRELQQKDSFIMKYFVNRSSDLQKNEVSEFFQAYKSQFSTPATLQLFFKEQQQMQQLRKKVQTR